MINKSNMRGILFSFLLFSTFCMSAQQIQRDDMLSLYRSLSIKNWDSAYIKANALIKKFPTDSSDFKATINYALILSAAGKVSNHTMSYPELRQTAKSIMGKHIMMPAHFITTDTLSVAPSITVLNDNNGRSKGTTIIKNAEGNTVLCFEDFEFKEQLDLASFKNAKYRCGGKLNTVEINSYMDDIWIMRLRITDAIILKM